MLPASSLVRAGVCPPLPDSVRCVLCAACTAFGSTRCSSLKISACMLRLFLFCQCSSACSLSVLQTSIQSRGAFAAPAYHRLVVVVCPAVLCLLCTTPVPLLLLPSLSPVGFTPCSLSTSPLHPSFTGATISLDLHCPRAAVVGGHHISSLGLPGVASRVPHPLL